MTDFMTDKGLDLPAVREHLNELRFVRGARKLPIGHVAELFHDQSPEKVARELARIRQQLAEHDLTLEYASHVSDQLFVVQQLTHRPEDRAAMARAMQWVSRITTVAGEMVVPAVIGAWLDYRWGTNFLTLIGLLIGVPLGLWHLIKLTKP